MKGNFSEKDLITILHDTFNYDDTGNLIWKKSKYNPKLIGTVAGSIHKTGYKYVTWLGKSWKLHRLIYAYCTGKFPFGVIDHINGNKLDNRFDNLRNVSIEENRQNVKSAQKNNLLGVLGIQERNGNFRARIRCNGVLHNLGTYKSLEEAIESYHQAKKLLHKGYVYEC